MTTSAQGKVHLSYPSDGKPKQTLDAGFYANMVRTAPGRSIAAAKGDVLLVIGSGESGESMVALGGNGKVYWTTKLPTDAQQGKQPPLSGRRRRGEPGALHGREF